MAPRSGVALSGCNWCSDVRSTTGSRVRRRDQGVRHVVRVFTTIVLMLAGLVSRAGAQSTATDPSDAFFDDTVVHDLKLTINPKDWQTLQIHYLENDYYVCDFRWRDQMLRNIGIRSRGTGSRSGTKPGLRVDFDRYNTD